jgi:hypothetical protein
MTGMPVQAYASLTQAESPGEAGAESSLSGNNERYIPRITSVKDYSIPTGTPEFLSDFYEHDTKRFSCLGISVED